MSYHVCAAKGCAREVEDHLLMCYPHWCRVPREVQRTVNRTWRAYSASPKSLIADRWQLYMEARQAAVDSVNTAPQPARTGATHES